MKTPDDVAEMLRLKACGWGLKRIARQLGCSHHTVKAYVAAGGVKPFRAPERRKRLDGLEDWLRERFIRHRGNADVVRQDLLAEQGLAVSPRTLQRAVQSYRQALKAEALATTRFETPPGHQLQIDFGERRSRSAAGGSRPSCSWPLSAIRAGCMCVRSGPRSRSTGSPGWRARSRPSAGCRRRC
jgi:transposase